MKAIVLAGGFAKRLWPLTKEQAKPLIDIGGKPVINYLIEKLLKLKEIDKIFISTNKKFEQDFIRWKEKYNFNIKLVVEESRCEEEKLGAIGSINFLINKENINDDIIIVNGDNLFDEKFDFSDVINFFKEKNAPIVCGFDVKTKERARLFGTIIFDKNKKVIDFIEKPEKPKTTFISMGCYLFPKNYLNLFSIYLNEGNSKDAPGFFLQWLYKRYSLFVYPYNGDWFDIGDFNSLDAAREFIKKKNKLA
ncbi:MAG: nucleotidyltransferase family protein [Candidatus Aenigmatarchaeota archaeon]